MATSTVAAAGKMARFSLVFAGVLSMASAQVATVFSMDSLPDWMRESAMTLQITGPSGVIVPFPYTVVPLTTNVGLNQSEKTREAIWIRGTMVSATSANYVNITDPEDVAYICCDPVNSSYITPSNMVNTLMRNKPKAILLYSMKGSCCGLELSDITYPTIFTMTDGSEAAETLNLTDSTDDVMGTIAGNVTAPQTDGGSQQAGSNSAVAMSILYSITGLITLLFLIIIATGALRAHRYPERYGPRSGYGGRPRQSRAKGIARAVLDTLPIVKFGDPAPAKPDPAHELESQAARPSHDPNMGTRLSAIPEEPQPTPQRRPSRSTLRRTNSDAKALPTTDEEGSSSSSDAKQEGAEHLGCSICTEDFTVGEDVRVLPCDHKFHPACIDPWLINVSGTCPLCRLDLRPSNGEAEDGTTADALAQLPPPLEVEGSGTEHATGQRRRSSRLLDLHRLRHASVEERIEILRRHRSQQQESATAAAAAAATSHTTAEHGAEGSERGSRAKLTDRLREKFRIRTRAQSPGRTAQNGEGPSS